MCGGPCGPTASERGVSECEQASPTRLYVTWVPLAGDEGRMGMTLVPRQVPARCLDRLVGSPARRGFGRPRRHGHTKRLVSLVTRRGHARASRRDTWARDAQSRGMAVEPPPYPRHHRTNSCLA